MNDHPKPPIRMLLTSHWLSMLGVLLAATAGFSWLFVLPIQVQGHTNNPLGRISPALPFIKKKAMELLKTNYASNEEAARTIPPTLARFYRDTYPEISLHRSTEISSAGAEIAEIYNRNVFPDLKVTWGTYPNNLGHTDFPGCFRCHDGSHSTSDAKSTITQDCNTCHAALAVEEAKPEILKTLGLADRIADLQKK